MKVVSESFWVVKRGNREEEYEDAVWPKDRLEVEGNTFRCAVADGATESSYSRQWAELLVLAFGEGRLDLAESKGLDELRLEWRNYVGNKPLPWFAEEKMKRGAFAAFVTLNLTNDLSQQSGSGHWHASAVGDSCLFQVRRDELIVSVPLQCSDDFNNCPYLIGSVSRFDVGSVERLDGKEGSWEPGDTFYLMTDALACWFLRQTEAKRHPWREFTGLSASGELASFRQWVENRRSEQEIRNDDCTLLCISIL